MKKINELSVKTKLNLPIVMLFVVFIVFVGLLIQLSSIDKKEKIKLDLVSNNSILIYKIAYFSNLISKGNKEYYDNLNDALISFSSNLELLKKGGKYKINRTTLRIENPVGSEIKLISNIEELWNNYSKNAHLLLETNNKILIKTASKQTENIHPLLLVANKELQKYHQKNNASISMILALYSACALFAFFVMISLILYYFRYYIYKPIIAISENAKLFIAGKKTKILQIKSNDEVGLITNIFNQVTTSIEKATIFASEIARGNTNYKYELSKNDKLGNALVKMQNSLKKAEELDKKVKEKQEKEIWNNQGKVFFSNLIMNNIDDLSDFTYKYISELVKHTDNIMGAFYLLDKDKLSQKACYAYKIKKFCDSRTNYNEGILSEIIKEKKKVIYTDIPKGYLKVTSGLGDAQPQFLIIYPIVFKGNTLGVIEMAGFKKMDEYKINFIDEIIKDLAFVLSDLRTDDNSEEIEKILEEQSEIIAEQNKLIRETNIEISRLKEELNEKEKLISKIDIPFEELSSIANN